MPPRVIYKVTCLCRVCVCVYATNMFRAETRGRIAGIIIFRIFRAFSLSAGRIRGDDASPPLAKRPNDALCMRVCIHRTVLILYALCNIIEVSNRGE